MKLTVLGCWGAYPAKGEATAGYLLQTGKHNILLDCGSGVLAQLPYHLPVEELDAVFLSHYHFDHVADLGCLQYAVMLAQRLGRRSKPLTVYAPECAGQPLPLIAEDLILSRKISPAEDVEEEGLKVSFLETVHDSYNLALKFSCEGRTLVYSGDTGYTEALASFAADCDLLLAEASLYEEQRGLVPWHLTAAETGKLAALAGARRLVLTHFPHYGELADLQVQAGRYYQGMPEMAACHKVFTVDD